MIVALNTRETEIVILVGRGLRYEEIAAQFGTTTSAVKEEMKRARKRTKTRTTAQLAVLVALARGKP